MAVDDSSGLLPRFSLADRAGSGRTFPTGRPTLLCFVKGDCPTCTLSAPLIEAAHGAFGTGVDVWAVSQDDDGGVAFAARHRLTMPVFADSDLREIGRA